MFNKTKKAYLIINSYYFYYIILNPYIQIFKKQLIININNSNIQITLYK